MGLSQEQLVELADRAWTTGDRQLAAALIAQAEGTALVATRGGASVARDGGSYTDRIGFRGGDA